MRRDFNWYELYLSWEIFSMNTGWKEKIFFTPVKVSSPSGGLRIGSEICDWWPPEKIANRRESLEKNGIMGVYWETKKVHYTRQNYFLNG